LCWGLWRRPFHPLEEDPYAHQLSGSCGRHGPSNLLVSGDLAGATPRFVERHYRGGETDSRAVVRFYNKRGTAARWIKEGKQAVKMTRLSCHRFPSNQVRLWLSVIASNLGSLWRRLVLPSRIDDLSLTNLHQRLVKTGGRLVKHARYYWLLLAESHLARRRPGWPHPGLPDSPGRGRMKKAAPTEAFGYTIDRCQEAIKKILAVREGVTR
jgi:hypothetical protein